MLENKKTSIILVLKVLEEYSDSTHYLTQKEIGEKIYSLYGISLERKSIANSLMLLQELDYDIVKSPRGGYALLSRIFDESEVRFIIDAIYSSKGISDTQAKNLVRKVSDSLSKNDRKDYDYLLKSSELARTTNKQVFLNIEIISEAIKTNKWIGFKYLTYDKDGNQVTRFDNYEYHASPCYLINNYGRYYLLAYRPKYDSVNVWRVDNMIDVNVMTSRSRVDPLSLKEFNKYKSISEYLNENVYLFGGNIIEAEVMLKSPEALSYIYEWFGSDIKVKKINDSLHAYIKCNEIAFYYWFMQYSEHLLLISPNSMKEKIKDAAKRLLEEYK